MNFTYDENRALKAGQSSYIKDTGAYNCTIKKAEWTENKWGQHLVLGVETEQGLSSDFISLTYKGSDGKERNWIVDTINAIMGCTGVKELTQTQHNGSLVAKELIGKQVGLFLQKRLYTKQDGVDSFSFQIVCPFSSKSRKTLLENKENKPAQWIEHLENTVVDKDDRKTNLATHTNSYGSYQAPVSPAKKTYGQNPTDTFTDIQPTAVDQSFDDDIPF